MMNLLSVIKDIFKPAVELIDDLHTSTEEKLAQKARTLDTYARAIEVGLQYESENLKQRAKIVEAEAKSEHWLTSTWRPIVMLTFLGLVVLDQTGLLAYRLASEAWVLLQLGLGGYVVGRTVEKTVPPIVDALKKKEET
jgi:hypothetical protein